MKKCTHPLLSIVLLGFSILLAACTADRPEVPADELYIREFIKKYGLPDASHSWSMAKSVETDVNVPGVSTGTLEIFTAPPGTPECRLAARLPIAGGRASGNISLPVGMAGVYLQVRDRGNIVRAMKQANVQLSALATTVDVVTMPAAEDLPVVEDFEKTAYAMPYTIREIYQEYLRDHAAASGDYTYLGAAEWFKTTGRSYVVDPDNPGWTSQELFPDQRVSTVIPKMKFLKNLYFEMGQALSYRTYLSPIFDHYHNPETGELEDGVFKEGINNIERYYHHSTAGYHLDPSVTFSVHEEGPVTMQCIWRGTQYGDFFGYFYYKEGEELTSEKLWNDIPKYTFVDDVSIRDESNLTQMKTVDHAWDGGDQETGWTDMDGMSTANCSSWLEHDGDDDRYIRGRKYYLAYYGENYDQKPSYIFPTGVRIGYFLYREGSIFFSDCKMEYELCRRLYQPNGDNVVKEGPDVRPFAAKFRMQGRTYVGFADESGDCDLNDVVFIAENVYPDPTDITPPELKEDDPEAMAWTLACEDLGSTDDTDFNDIVLDVEHVAGSGKITLIPRAAGGVLVSEIYFREGDNVDQYTYIGEIHNLMSSVYSGNPVGNYPMLNTELSSHHVDPKRVRPISLTVPEDFDFADPENGFLARIRITTRHYDESVSDAQVINAYTEVTGGSKIPQMILLNGNWYWPTERADISQAYPKFKDWVKNGNIADWTNYRNAALTVSHRIKCSH